MTKLEIASRILFIVVIIESIFLVSLITNKLVNLKERVNNLETQIVELQGDK